MRSTLLSALAAVASLAACSTLAHAQANCQHDRQTISAQRGIVFEPATVTPGQWYWKLVDVAWCDENQSGGKINIFYKALDANGQAIANQKCIAAYPFNPSNFIPIFTKAAPDWGDFPMSGGNWCPFWPEGPNGPYNAWVDSFCPANGSSCPPQAAYPSDRVRGMGLPCNRHECYFLTWQFTQAPNPTPVIERSPASFTRQVTEGDHLPDDTFTLQNTGGGTLNYTITDNAAWLSVAPASGSCTTETDTITIHYDTAELPLASYTGTITIAGNADNAPQIVTVNLTVNPVRYLGDFDDDGDVDQSDFGHLQACLTGPGIAQNDAACANAKLDVDPDVDQDDVNRFQSCLSGPGLLPPESCRQ